jgi:hypothetical protein
MPTQHPLWLDYLTAIGPLFGVVAVLLIGLVQAYLQRRQLHQDLFSKRFQIYSVIGAFISTAIGSEFGFREVGKFHNDTSHAEFLFGDRVVRFLNEIEDAAQKLVVANQRLALQMCDPSLVDLVKQSEYQDQREDLIRLLLRAGRCQNDIFRDYLVMDADLPWYSRFERYMDGMLDKLDGTFKRRSEGI